MKSILIIMLAVSMVPVFAFDLWSSPTLDSVEMTISDPYTIQNPITNEVKSYVTIQRISFSTDAPKVTDPSQPRDFTKVEASWTAPGWLAKHNTWLQLGQITETEKDNAVFWLINNGIAKPI